MFRSILMTSVLVIASSTFAQTKGYQFNQSGNVKPEFDKGLKFEIPTESAEGKVDLIKEAEGKSSSLFMAPVGYPKKELILSYNPGYNGFKNILSGSRTYSYGGLVTQSFSAGMKLSSSLTEHFNLDLNIMRVSVPTFNDTAAGFAVVGSSTYLYTLSFGGDLSCKTYESAYHQFCYGYQINLDSFPSLTFPETSNTEIQMTAAKDMTLGLYMEFMRPLFGNSVMKSKVGLDYGFGVGQSGDLVTKSNQRAYGSVGAEWPTGAGHTSLMGGGEYRLANMATSLDTWKIQNLSYFAKIGYRWEFGSQVD